jgi:hypothetical protein
MTHRLIALAALLVLFADTARAQVADLAARTGQAVFVVDRDAREVAGALKSVTADTIVIATGTADITIARQDVRLVEVRGDALWNGVALGAAFGAAGWITATAFACDERGPACAASRAPLLSLPYLGFGALIDRALEGRHVVYQSEPRATGPVHDFTSLWQKTRSGETVFVTDDVGQRVRGTLLRTTPSTIVMLDHGTEREFSTGRVRSIARRGDPVFDGAAIGAAVGIAAGARDGAWSALLLGGTYAGIGALVDAGLHGRTTIYRPAATARHPQVRASLAPGQARLVVSF